MDFWTFLGFVAVLALLAAIEKQLMAIHKDIVETKVKVEYISALIMNKEVPAAKLSGSADVRDRIAVNS